MEKEITTCDICGKIINTEASENVIISITSATTIKKKTFNVCGNSCVVDIEQELTQSIARFLLVNQIGTEEKRHLWTYEINNGK